MRTLPRCLVFGLALVAGCSSPTAPTPPAPAPPSPAALAIECPAPVDTITASPAGLPVTFAPPAASGGHAPVSIACTPASGDTFPVGGTDVRCTATDADARTASCSFRVTVVRPPELGATRFLAFGDSVTVGVVASLGPGGTRDYVTRTVPNDAYPAVLGRLLSARYATQSIQVVNEGLGGERAADAVGRFRGAVNAMRPDVVLLLEGYNDLSSQGAAGIPAAMTAIGDMAKEARFRGARVFLATLTPPPPAGDRGISNSVITAFNRELREVARGEQAGLVDVYAAFAPNAAAYNSADGLHPNEAGYRAIAEAFFAAIRGALERP